MKNPLRPSTWTQPEPVQVVTTHVDPDEYARIFMSGWDSCLAQLRVDDPDDGDRLFEDRLRQERYDVLVRLAQTEPSYGAAHRFLMDAARAELASGPVERPTLDVQPFRDVLAALRVQRTCTGGAARDAFAFAVSLMETALDQYKGDPT